MTPFEPMSDGVIRLRPPEATDAQLLIGGRDEVFHRWLGPGSDDPQPTACITVGRDVVGWVDYDIEQEWLQPGEVNLGYTVFAAHRGKGYATRAVQLLMHHLAVRTTYRTATLAIDLGNERSVALARRVRFTPAPGERCFSRPVPPLIYSDGIVAIRPPRIADLDADLEAKDDEQIDWMWRPGEREAWEAMTPSQQRDHARRGLEERLQGFGSGPKWTFSVDSPTTAYIAYVDCDLANPDVPAGEANITYSAHPAHRRKGHVSRAVRLVHQFLRDHTGARWAHIIVDAENVASLHVARAVGAVPEGEWLDDRGRRMIRHVTSLR